MRRGSSSSPQAPSTSSQGSRCNWARGQLAARRPGAEEEADRRTRRAEPGLLRRVGHRPVRPDRPDPDPVVEERSAGAAGSTQRFVAAGPGSVFRGLRPGELARGLWPVPWLGRAGNCRQVPYWRRQDPGRSCRGWLRCLRSSDRGGSLLLRRLSRILGKDLKEAWGRCYTYAACLLLPSGCINPNSLNEMRFSIEARFREANTCFA